MAINHRDVPGHNGGENSTNHMEISSSFAQELDNQKEPPEGIQIAQVGGLSPEFGNGDYVTGQGSHLCQCFNSISRPPPNEPPTRENRMDQGSPNNPHAHGLSQLDEMFRADRGVIRNGTLLQGETLLPHSIMPGHRF